MVYPFASKPIADLEISAGSVCSAKKFMGYSKFCGVYHVRHAWQLDVVKVASQAALTKMF